MLVRFWQSLFTSHFKLVVSNGWQSHHSTKLLPKSQGKLTSFLRKVVIHFWRIFETSPTPELVRFACTVIHSTLFACTVTHLTLRSHCNEHPQIPWLCIHWVKRLSYSYLSKQVKENRSLWSWSVVLESCRYLGESFVIGSTAYMVIMIQCTAWAFALTLTLVENSSPENKVSNNSQWLLSHFFWKKCGA